MDAEKRALNYECNYNIYMIDNLMTRHFKSPADRKNILLWIKKLQRCNTTIEELTLRNEFIYYLLTCVKAGELKPPFDECPKPGNIRKLQNLLPENVANKSCGKGVNLDWITDLEREDASIPDIYRKSPDGGIFLSAQPIPKCGAFCYVAIVSKSTEKSFIDDCVE